SDSRSFPPSAQGCVPSPIRQRRFAEMSPLALGGLVGSRRESVRLQLSRPSSVTEESRQPSQAASHTRTGSRAPTWGSRAVCGSRHGGCCRSPGWRQTFPPVCRCQPQDPLPDRGPRPACLSDSRFFPPSRRESVPSQNLLGRRVVPGQKRLEPSRSVGVRPLRSAQRPCLPSPLARVSSGRPAWEAGVPGTLESAQRPCLPSPLALVSHGQLAWAPPVPGLSQLAPALASAAHP